MTSMEFDLRREHEERTPVEINLKKRGLTKEKSLDLLRQMWEIRLFEEPVYDLLGKNQIKGASGGGGSGGGCNVGPAR
ncbi:MAG: hypothetical protein ABSF61_05110 [Anaerolineales bacterium]